MEESSPIFFDKISKTVTLVGRIEFERKTELFNAELSILSVIRYTDFLREYFENLEIFPTEDFVSKLVLNLSDNVTRSDPYQINIRNSWSNHRVIPILARHCPAIEAGSVGSGAENDGERIPFSQIFEHHRFVNEEKRFKVLILGEEFQQKIPGEIFSKINEKMISEIKKAEETLKYDFEIKNLVSSARLKKAFQLDTREKHPNYENVCNKKIFPEIPIDLIKFF